MKKRDFWTYCAAIICSVLLVGCSSVAQPVIGKARTNSQRQPLHRVAYNQGHIKQASAKTITTTNSAQAKIASVASAKPQATNERTVSSSIFSFFSLGTSTPPTLWDSLRDDFKIDHHEFNGRVRTQIYWYQTHRKVLEAELNHSAPYLYYILQEVKKRHLPGEFALLPIIESAYNPFAHNPSGASGMWQLMPMTAHGFGIKTNSWYDGRRDFYAATKAALNYFVYLGNFFNGHWLLAIAAYDAGEGTIEKSLAYNAHRGGGYNYFDLSFRRRETFDYVPRLLALAIIINHPARYGITLPAIKNAPYFAAVKVHKQIELAKAAKLANTSLTAVEKLNPGYSRHVTAPHTSLLLLPIKDVAIFEHNLARYKGSLARVIHRAEIPWEHYRVRAGDTLAGIAHRFRTSIAKLEHENRIRPHDLHPNQVLKIPSKNTTNPILLASAAQTEHSKILSDNSSVTKTPITQSKVDISTTKKEKIEKVTAHHSKVATNHSTQASKHRKKSNLHRKDQAQHHVAKHHHAAQKHSKKYHRKRYPYKKRAHHQRTHKKHLRHTMIINASTSRKYHHAHHRIIHHRKYKTHARKHYYHKHYASKNIGLNKAELRRENHWRFEKKT